MQLHRRDWAHSKAKSRGGHPKRVGRPGFFRAVLQQPIFIGFSGIKAIRQ
jgi:hypothetical protein